MRVNSRQSLCCEDCSTPQPQEGFWDISALSLVYEFQPFPRNAGYIITIKPVDFDTTKEISSALTVWPELPTVDQSLRLFGFPGMTSISCDWGRVVHFIEGLLLVNHIYNENGASGGAALDRMGRIVGVMSCVNMKEPTQIFVEPIGSFIKLLQKHHFYQNRHDPKNCNFCQENPLAKKKFCFR